MAKGRFSGARQRHVALLLDLAGPLGLNEILRFVGGDRASLDRSLRSLEAQGLLSAVESERGAAPGRASRLWSLTATGAAAVPRRREDDVGRLVQGEAWVAVSVSGAKAAALEDCLADGRLLAAANWVGRLDGPGHVYVFTFPPQHGNLAAQTLARVLRGVGECLFGTVGPIESASTFVDARTVARTVLDAYEP